ncbi:MAG: RND transporter [Candidatus Sedimenticola sp. 20ELBAFRAG]
MNWLDDLPMPFVVVAAVFLGLAPFVPEPHVLEKLKMLAAGTLVKPVDIFDLFLHSAPFVVLILKLLRIKGRV